MVHFAVEWSSVKFLNFLRKIEKEKKEIKKRIWNLFTINAAAAVDVDLILDFGSLDSR